MYTSIYNYPNLEAIIYTTFYIKLYTTFNTLIISQLDLRNFWGLRRLWGNVNDDVFMKWSTSSNEPKVYAEPKISINKLGEYLISPSARREAILKAQKRPPKIIVTRYNGVGEAICNYLSGGMNGEVLLNAIAAIKARKADTDFKEEDIKLSVGILEKVPSLSLPDFKNLTISRFDQYAAIKIEGVTINVNPDLIVRGILRNKNVVGAIKLHVVKGALKREAQSFVALILHQFVDEFIKKDGELAKESLCYSLDVFSNQIEPSPRAVAKKITQIHSACREIASRWPSI